MRERSWAKPMDGEGREMREKREECRSHVLRPHLNDHF